MTYTSPPLEIPDPDDDEVGRLDLQVFGVGHRDASYEVRVFLNNPTADGTTSRAASDGYAGSYYVFGHGGCVGDAMHCHVPEDRPHRFDQRPRHKLTPHVRVLQVTDAWRSAAARARSAPENDGTVAVTLVVGQARGPDGSPVTDVADVLVVERLALVAYA